MRLWIWRINIKKFREDMKMIIIKEDKHINNLHMLLTTNRVFHSNQVRNLLHIVYHNYKQKLNLIFDY
jgi:hypothetical protein